MKDYKFKQQLTIQTIGKQRFWLGIIIGLGFAIALLLLLTYYKELFRFFVAHWESRLYELSDNDISFNKVIISMLSVSIGFSITIFIWFSSGVKYKYRRYIHYTLMNAMLLSFITLMYLAKMSDFIPHADHGITSMDYFPISGIYLLLLVMPSACPILI